MYYKYTSICSSTSTSIYYLKIVYIRTNLDFSDIICDQTFNNSFCCRLQMIQYYEALSNTCNTMNANRNTLSGIRFEALQQRWWQRKLCSYLSYSRYLFHPAYPAYYPLRRCNLFALFITSSAIKWKNFNPNVGNCECKIFQK